MSSICIQIFFITTKCCLVYHPLQGCSECDEKPSKIHSKSSGIYDIKAHDSESQGQEEGPMQQTRELFTRSTVVKLANTLNKPL